MRKIQVFAILVLLSSCAIPHYKHTYESAKGMDLRKGKWLVNTIDSDLSLKSQDFLTAQLMKKLKKIGDISVVYIDSVRLDYLLPSQMQFELSPETLATLKRTTDFDFIINVKAHQIKDDLGAVIMPSNTYNEINQSEVYIDVYAIASSERVYSQRIVATISSGESDGKVYLSKSASGLIFGALKKGIKQIKKYSIRN